MIDQIAIAALGVTSIFLSQSLSPKLRRSACLFGLASQPFWMYSAITAGQWGIFVLTLFYTAAWARGVWNFWLKQPP